ncbi:glucose-6-phosphate 1-epimerase [Pasteurella langaaensis DSM 22999]|uniref:Putative glucose-6-phosphate 1-epimerase n=1 Tax=Alitibacter langaaensis DSM 22999 TaxID=1122935 RepID=A0A2U0TH04_9PAST|nr:D-hexose-6-phosphate mutarotase [Pasteurella langaaensis]PVX42893.1 glucose-6-phosphate 1-epimerase [Pasteurella langaaensis DSM 22999]
MEVKLIKQLAPELALYHYNDIPVLALKHAVGTAKISLQGAQLISWIPAHTEQDVVWLSEIEPFNKGEAIRGGIPICYPWFGKTGTPSHGYARLQLWQLVSYDIQADVVYLNFLLETENAESVAHIEMTFSEEFHLEFTNYCIEQEPQLALHTYFNVGDISQSEIQQLPTTTFNVLTQQQETVPPTRVVNEYVECIYPANERNVIVDTINQRTIEILHENASEIVMWNPWHNETSAMSEEGHNTMICIETARISERLAEKPVGLTIRVK